MIRVDYVERIINTWDPIGLFPYSPVDEYHDEIDHIKCILATATNATELSEGIYSIFVDSFGTGIFKKSKGECKEIAQRLLAYESTEQFSPRCERKVDHRI